MWVVFLLLGCVVLSFLLSMISEPPPVLISRSMLERRGRAARWPASSGGPEAARPCLISAAKL